MYNQFMMHGQKNIKLRTNEILQHIVFSSGLSRPGIIDARVRYRAAARPLRNTVLDGTLFPVAFRFPQQSCNLRSFASHCSLRSISLCFFQGIFTGEERLCSSQEDKSQRDGRQYIGRLVSTYCDTLPPLQAQRQSPRTVVSLCYDQWRTQEFFSGGGGVQQIQLRTERTGIWGRQPPSQGFWRQL